MNPVHAALAYFVWFLSTYYLLFFILTLFANESRLFERRRLGAQRPLVTILVPAYNEQGKIAQTIASLKRITYERVEVIVINDGSKDRTSDETRAAIKGDGRFRLIDRRENRGKGASLNDGIAAARGEYIVTIDADTVVEPNILQKVLPYFDDEKVGAVTVSVLVKRPQRFLHRVLELEYIIGLSLFLRLLSFMGIVFVTPGPFSIYRASMLRKIQGFDASNITEDLEIAYRIRFAGYRIVNCMDAKVYTILPPTFKGLYRQRRRWYTGAIQTMYQHRKQIFTTRQGLFSAFIVFNYSLIFVGIILFLSSMYLAASHLTQQLWEYQYTGWNFLENLKEYRFDILRFSGIEIIGLMGLLSTFVLLGLGLYYTRTNVRHKKAAIAGYPVLFFLYQLWWIAAIISAVRGKRVKWK
jgi:cellulose synthase/poly-beta-1,6-N-acetylglucosamine synthase-like glycosyltransferase